MTPVRFGRPDDWVGLERATLAHAVAARCRAGERPTEWEIGDALNQLGPHAVGSIAAWLRQEVLPRSREGHPYKPDRLLTFAFVAARFPVGEMRLCPPLSFSHYQDLAKKRVPLGLCALCLGLAVKNGVDHKGMRRLTEAVLESATVGVDGVTRVEPVDRYGLTERVEIRELTDPLQLTISG